MDAAFSRGFALTGNWHVATFSFCAVSPVSGPNGRSFDAFSAVSADPRAFRLVAPAASKAPAAQSALRRVIKREVFGVSELMATLLPSTESRTSGSI
jgi:hypothetical protein